MTPPVRTLALAVALLATPACGGDDGDGGGEPTTTTLAADDVVAALEVGAVADTVEVTITIDNEGDDDVVVSDPTAGRALEPDGDALRIVSARGEVDPASAEAGDALPRFPGLLIGAGRTLEQDVPVGRLPEGTETLALCVEVAAADAVAGDPGHADPVAVEARAPDVPARFACTDAEPLDR